MPLLFFFAGFYSYWGCNGWDKWIIKGKVFYIFAFRLFFHYRKITWTDGGRADKSGMDGIMVESDTRFQMLSADFRLSFCSAQLPEDKWMDIFLSIMENMEKNIGE